jgi:hypothetical protein
MPAIRKVDGSGMTETVLALKTPELAMLVGPRTPIDPLMIVSGELRLVNEMDIPRGSPVVRDPPAGNPGVPGGMPDDVNVRESGGFETTRDAESPPSFPLKMSVKVPER